MGAGDLDDGRVPAPLEADPWLGNVVNGRYAVERELGWGSLGRVFLVRDLLAGPEAAPLALKAVRRDRHTEQAERYLRHEFRCLSGLDHPHLVGAHSFDRDRAASPEGPGIPFFTLDAIAGETLVAYVQRVGIEAAPRVLAEALRALAYLHQRGWLHLDLKPMNVLVDETGCVRLIDLHLARRRGQPGLGSMRGTIAYMSPEVIRGREADPRADLYGLGAVAYEALCASAPFAEAGDPMAVLRGHASRAPLSFAAREAEVPARLEDWVRCLLAKAPSERYSDAHEALRALAAASETELPLETEATRQAYLRRGPLVEREEERRLVLDAAQVLREGGRPAPLLVTGEAGSGRTRLLDWLAPRLEVDGVRPLRLEGEAGLAKALPLILGRHGLARLCPEGALDLEALLDPERGGVAAPQDLPLPVRQAHAATELVARLAREEHLALLVGDLGALDPLSRSVLEELLRSEAALLVVACATRPSPDELGEEPTELPGAVEHRLRHLTRPGAAELIASLVGREEEAPAEALTERLWELTAGNPRHLGEVVRGLSQDGALVDAEGRLVLEVDDLERVLSSADLGALAAGRVARLDAASRRVLLALAICPAPRSPVFLQALASLPPDLAKAAVADLLQRAFVREATGGTLALDHAPLAAAVRAAEPDQVEDLHRRALLLLESRHPATVSLGGPRAGAGAGDRAEELLWHAEAAGDAKRAWASARAAGRAAASAGDHPRAVSAYRRGLSQAQLAGADESARREVVAGLATSLGSSGRRSQALELLEKAGQGLAPWALGLRIRARLRKDQGHVRDALEDLAAARAAAQRSASLGEEEGACEEIAGLSEEASVRLWCGDYAAARELGERALDELRRRWPGVLNAPGQVASEGAAPQQESLRRRLEVAAAEACDALHHACHFQGLDEEATAYLQEALGIKSSSDMGRIGEPTPAEAQAVLKRAIRHGRGPLLGDAAGAQVARSPIEAAFERADRSDDLLRLRQRRSRLLEAAGDLDGAGFALLNLGHLHRAKARLCDADDLYRRGGALFGRSECHAGESLVDLSRARLLAQVGQAEVSEELADRARQTSARLGLRWVEGLARLAQAEALLAAGDVAGAREAASQAQGLVSELGNRPQQAELDLFWAELELAAGQAPLAAAALARFEAAPPGSRSLSLRLRAELIALALPGEGLEQRAETALAEAEARGHLELAWRLAWRRAQLRRARGYQEGELEDTISAMNLLRRISERLEPEWRGRYLADPERTAVATRFQELRS